MSEVLFADWDAMEINDILFFLDTGSKKNFKTDKREDKERLLEDNYEIFYYLIGPEAVREYLEQNAYARSYYYHQFGPTTIDNVRRLLREKYFRFYADYKK